MSSTKLETERSPFAPRPFGLPSKQAAKPSEPHAGPDLFEKYLQMRRVSSFRRSAENLLENTDRPKRGPEPPPGRDGSFVVQGFFEVGSVDLGGFVREQEAKQQTGREAIDREVAEGRLTEPFTTVGFEAEFAQTTPNDNPLAGVSHLVLSESSAPDLKYTGLKFVLETDADNAIELVTPPFLVRSRPDHPVPLADEVAKIDGMLRTTLARIASTAGNIGGLEEQFGSVANITFAIADARVAPMNLSSRSAGKYGLRREYSEISDKARLAYIQGRGPKPDQTETIVDESNIASQTLKEIGVKLTEKGGGITTQVNFATDAPTVLLMQDIGRESSTEDSRETLATAIKGLFIDLESDVFQKMKSLKSAQGLAGREVRFLRFLARNLAGQMAVPFQHLLQNYQAEMFADKEKDALPSKEDKRAFLVSSYLSSLVKDIDATWVKSTFLDFMTAVLPPSERQSWLKIYRLMREMVDRAFPQELYPPVIEDAGEPVERVLRRRFNKEIGAQWKKIRALMTTSIEYVERGAINIAKGRLVPEAGPGPDEEVPFLEHAEEWITPRQDTLIHPDKVQIDRWQQEGIPLHVVESRTKSVEMITELNKKLDVG